MKLHSCASHAPAEPCRNRLLFAGRFFCAFIRHPSGCKQGDLCFASRGEVSGIFTAAGLAAGALVGALIPTHSKPEVVYSVH